MKVARSKNHTSLWRETSHLAMEESALEEETVGCDGDCLVWARRNRGKFQWQRQSGLGWVWSWVGWPWCWKKKTKNITALAQAAGWVVEFLMETGNSWWHVICLYMLSWRPLWVSRCVLTRHWIVWTRGTATTYYSWVEMVATPEWNGWQFADSWVPWKEAGFGKKWRKRTWCYRSQEKEDVLVWLREK